MEGTSVLHTSIARGQLTVSSRIKTSQSNPSRHQTTTQASNSAIPLHEVVAVVSARAPISPMVSVRELSGCLGPLLADNRLNQAQGLSYQYVPRRPKEFVRAAVKHFKDMTAHRRCGTFSGLIIILR